MACSTPGAEPPILHSAVKLVVFTDSVTLFSNNAALTRATISAVADRLELRVDDVVERRRGLSTRFVVTLTGTGEQIEAFRETLEGDGWLVGGLVDQLVINPVLGALQRSIGRRWRKRPPRNWGPKPSAVPRAPDGERDGP